jgi:DNA-binding MarR family transcriptional regulator
MLSKLNDMASHELYQTEVGLNLAEARCLACIGSHSHVTVKRLAFEANLDKGTASRAAQALVERGLAQKSSNPDDGRCVRLALTPAGRTRWDKVMPLIAERNQALTACLDERERADLLDMLERMLTHAGADQYQHKCQRRPGA